MSKGTEAFDAICGNCASIDLADITVDDFRAQATIHGASEEETLSAIDGLIEYQDWGILNDEGEG